MAKYFKVVKVTTPAEALEIRFDRTGSGNEATFADASNTLLRLTGLTIPVGLDLNQLMWSLMAAGQVVIDPSVQSGVLVGEQSRQLVEANASSTGVSTAELTLELVRSVYDSAAMADLGWTTSDAGATFTRTGLYGTAVLNADTGQVAYTLNNNDADTQAMRVGQTYTESLNVAIKDSLTNQPMGEGVFGFSITGANDVPTLTSFANDQWAGTTTGQEWTYIHHSALLAAGNENDPESQPLKFKVSELSSGAQLQMKLADGSWVSAGAGSVLTSGAQFRWKPPLGSSQGIFEALKLVAIDDQGLESSTAVPLAVNLIEGDMNTVLSSLASTMKGLDDASNGGIESYVMVGDQLRLMNVFGYRNPQTNPYWTYSASSGNVDYSLWAGGASSPKVGNFNLVNATTGTRVYVGGAPAAAGGLGTETTVEVRWSNNYQFTISTTSAGTGSNNGEARFFKDYFLMDEALLLRQIKFASGRDDLQAAKLADYLNALESTWYAQDPQKLVSWWTQEHVSTVINTVMGA